MIRLFAKIQSPGLFKSRPMTWAFLLAMVATQSIWAQLNQNCVVSVLNRTVQVKEDGSWVLPNIPANFGPVRARATCVENNVTRSGQSALFTLPPNGSVDIPRIILGATTQIPTQIILTASTTTLTNAGQSVQVSVTGKYASGPDQNLTSGSTGTTYLVSNPQLATITADGFLTARQSGTVLLQVQNEGTQALLSFSIVLSRDSDGDGILDDIEIREGLDPNNPADALDDLDRDGLSNRNELTLGTNIRNPDTDGDTIKDGEEVVAGLDGFITSPLLRDTDGDGVPDNIEVASGSNPTLPTSINLSQALSKIMVTPSTFVIDVNSLNSQSFQQLTVTGEFKLGGTINLTARARGTNYASSNINLCNFGAEDGRVFGSGDGACQITVTNSGFSAIVSGTVRNFTPAALSFIAIPGYANSVDALGGFAYVAAGAAGLQVVGVSNPRTPQIVGSLDTPGNANDVRVVGNLAYIADGVSGLRIMNVSNPQLPTSAGTVDTPGDAIDVMVFGSRAYIADGSSGLAIINVTNPATPTVLKQLALPGVARGVDVMEGPNNTLYAILVTDSPSPALRVVNVTDPANASLVASLTLAGSPKDLRVNNRFAYIAAYTGGLQIVDLTNPLTPTARGSLPSQIVPRDVEVAGNFAVLAEQLFPNAVPVVDISNPQAPQLRPIIDFSGLGDYAGTGIALNGPFLYMTGVSFVVSFDKGTTGDTRLFVGQYLAQEDRFGVPPVLSLTAPANNSSAIRGSGISLRATATDDVGVASVTFRVNGVDVGTDTTAPYELLYTVPANATTFTVQAVSIDFGGNTSTTPPVSVSGIPDPLTTLSGRIIRQDTTPIVGASVNCGGNSTVTIAGGLFRIPGIPTINGDIACTATFLEAGKTLRGTTLALAPVLGGTTNYGDLTIRPSGKIGLLHSDSTGAIRSMLISQGILAEDLVDVPVGGTAPTLASLSQFGAVLVWSNFGIGQPDALGDVLANFVDSGGGVVLSTYVFSQSWRIGGRILTPGYSPFAVSASSQTTSGALNLNSPSTILSHPLLQGVTNGTYFTNGNYTNPPLTAGANLLAVDTAGNRVVAVSPSNRVVGISIYPPNATSQARLFANALNFVR